MSQDFRAAAPRIAAGVLIRDETERVLLVNPTYKSGWDIPGGYVEPGESPREAAVREVSEELGVDLSVGRLLIVDWAPLEEEGDKILFIFDGGRVMHSVAQDLKVQVTEIGEIRFAARDELENLVPDRLLRRVLAALDAEGGEYLEHGRSVDSP